MIERYISVKQERIIQPIAYVENTNMIPIVLHITDYKLPEGVIARAYAGTNSVSTVLCEIRGNDIIIPVVSGFFKAGKNILQIRVVQGEENLLISFPIPVHVKRDITSADAEEPIQHPGMMDQLITKYGEMKKEFQESKEKISDAVSKANFAEKKVEDIQEQIGVLSELKSDIKTSLVNAFNWLIDKIGGADISGIGDGTVTGAIDELHKNMNNMDSLFDRIYPVGSIYMSVSATNPSELFGGTWVAWGAGRVPVGVNSSDTDFNTVEKAGGTKTQKLYAAIGATNSDSSRIGYAIAGAIAGLGYAYTLKSADGATGAVPASQVNHSTPVYKSNKTDATTVQPYITCYMFKRTA